MVRLVVALPAKRKVEVECLASATFGDVKALVAKEIGLDAAGQRLLCGGKERKEDAETLAAAGITAGSNRLMLLLAPGYSMPAPTAEAIAAEALAALPPLAGPADSEGTLPSPPLAGAEALDMVHVCCLQGLPYRRCHVRVPQGLSRATFAELAEYLVAELELGVQSAELSFMRRGSGAKPARPTDSLGSDGEATVLAFFRRGFRAATWLAACTPELEEVEIEVSRLSRRVEANLADAETAVRVARAADLAEGLRQGLDDLQVIDATLPGLRGFRERVGAVCALAGGLRSAAR